MNHPSSTPNYGRDSRTQLALVTGTSSSIGQAFARWLGADGKVEDSSQSLGVKSDGHVASTPAARPGEQAESDGRVEERLSSQQVQWLSKLSKLRIREADRLDRLRVREVKGKLGGQ